MRKALLFILCLNYGSPTLPSKGKRIDQLESLNINGSQQWLLYRGDNTEKPVVLFVYGGPGSPLMFFSRGFDELFLKDFVVVHWDQRHSGKSFDQTKSLSDFSMQQIAIDGIAVVAHLKKKFAKSKILLVGHSWGSVVGAAMAESKPSDFFAFVSVGTVADMSEGDAIKYAFLKERVKVGGDKSDGESLAKMGPPPWKEFEQLAAQSQLMTKFKGTFFALSGDQVNSAVSQTKEYSEADFQKLDLSMAKIWKQMSHWLAKYKAVEAVPKLDVPVYFAQGAHDMATPRSLAKDYFDSLSAPKGKRWIEFSGSAHFPMYEEPEKFLSLLKQTVN